MSCGSSWTVMKLRNFCMCISARRRRATLDVLVESRVLPGQIRSQKATAIDAVVIRRTHSIYLIAVRRAHTLACRQEL
jgi:hypothetical protein